MIPKLSRIAAFAILSRTYKLNAQSRSHMPGSSAYIQSHKQACSRELSEQRKYREYGEQHHFQQQDLTFTRNRNVM